MEKQKKIVVDRINELCKEKNLSYYQLAYRSTVPMSTLMNILNGKTKNPSIFTIVKFCDAFGISLVEFFDTDAFNNLPKTMVE